MGENVIERAGFVDRLLRQPHFQHQDHAGTEQGVIISEQDVAADRKLTQ
ncbi:hypothetical protein [Pseudomonas syringae group genomosp. 3]|nr:hypothetical protein [Pseudomonas syringae group genomosp. 3]